MVKTIADPCHDTAAAMNQWVKLPSVWPLPRIAFGKTSLVKHGHTPREQNRRQVNATKQRLGRAALLDMDGTPARLKTFIDPFRSYPDQHTSRRGNHESLHEPIQIEEPRIEMPVMDATILLLVPCVTQL